MSIQPFLIVALSILALTVVLAIALYVFNRRKSLASHGAHKFPISSFHVITGGVFVSAVVLLWPAVLGEFETDNFFTTLGVSVQKTLQLFTIDADFSLINTGIEKDPGIGEVVKFLYKLYGSALHVIAPVLTAGVVLSFFKNAKAFLRYYVFSLPSDLYFISELNDRSIALAEDIVLQSKKNGKRVKIVFTDVFEQEEDETNYELVNRARSIGCILFAKDITEIRLRPWFGKNIKRKLFFIGIDEDENLRQALAVISACRKSPSQKRKPVIDKNGNVIENNKQEKKSVYNTPNTEFYVFSRSAESEALLDSIDNGDMKVRRIDENRTFALRTLIKYPIFNDALPPEEGKSDKQLNILLVGLGMIGTEFVKALSWVGQMYGYVLNLHIFDGEPDIAKRLRNIAPELIDNNFATRREKRDDESLTDYYNDKTGITYRERVDGDSYYNYFFYDDINVKTQEFLDIVAGIGPISTIYVTLGDDELNIETAMRLRTMMERAAIDYGREIRPIPSIYSVVYSEIKNEIISSHNGHKTIKNDDYGITIIGSLKSSYTLAAIEQNNIENAGLECHLKWASSAKDKENSKDSYRKYEYFRRSSMAEAMHGYLRKELGLMPSLVDAETKKLIYKHEHCRWCAFVRAEGYVSRKTRSDLAKTHNNLRPYNDLTDDIRLLDEIVLTEIIDSEEE